MHFFKVSNITFVCNVMAKIDTSSVYKLNLVCFQFKAWSNFDTEI